MKSFFSLEFQLFFGGLWRKSEMQMLLCNKNSREDNSFPLCRLSAVVLKGGEPSNAVETLSWLFFPPKSSRDRIQEHS
jgi:hypothetical protein